MAAAPLACVRGDSWRGLQLTKGSLAVHLRRLEEAGSIAVHKGFVGRISRTTYPLRFCYIL